MVNSLIGKTLGQYKIKRIIGAGGMGSVYEAEQIHFPDDSEWIRAIKVMHPHISRHDGMIDLFKQEARIAVRFVGHPNIVTVHDFGEQKGLLYLLMNLIPGENLRQILRRLEDNQRRLDLSDVIGITKKICSTLEDIHAAEVSHRDLKPENIMFKLDEAGEPIFDEPIIMDLGIAKLAQEAATEQGIGTPMYASPEQLEGRSVDHRTDIYAVGVILYELSVGRRPFKIEERRSKTPPPRPTDIDPTLPRDLEMIILKALEKDPNRRYARAKDMETALGEVKPKDLLPTILSSSFSTVHLDEVHNLQTPNRPEIKNPRLLELPDQVVTVLEELFADYKEVIVRKRYDQGFSGAYVIEVQPIKSDGRDELYTIVKIAAIGLIQKEYQAYKDHIENIVDKTVSITRPPITLAKSGWGGVRYSMAGGGLFEIISLREYCLRDEISVEQILRIQEDILKVMQVPWRHIVDPDEGRTFSFRQNYSRLLPVDLFINHLPAASGADEIQSLKPGSPLSEVEIKARVRLEGFILVKEDVIARTITLKTADNCYYLRVEFESETAMNSYLGHTLDEVFPKPIEGQVSRTRESQFRDIMVTVLEPTITIDTEEILLPDTSKSLHNPIYYTLNVLLDEHLDVWITTNHGDFNLENILIRLDNGDVNLIDFAEANRMHVLNDPLRFETEVVTKIISEIIRRRNLPLAATMHDFYEQLDRATFKNELFEPAHPHKDLEIPFRMLVTHRQEIRRHFRSGPAEYYKALTIFLIGAMKFANLETPQDKYDRSIPKQAAFWAAATVLAWTGLPKPPKPAVQNKGSKPQPPTTTPLQKLWKRLRKPIVIKVTITICSVAFLAAVLLPAVTGFPAFIEDWLPRLSAISSDTTPTAQTATAEARQTGVAITTATAAAEATATAQAAATQTAIDDEPPDCNQYADTGMALISDGSTAFCLDVQEVTTAQYQECVDDEVCTSPVVTYSHTQSPGETYFGNPTYDNYPVIQIDWTQAVTYCDYVDKRLPTAAEWDLAAEVVARTTALTTTVAAPNDTRPVTTNDLDVTPENIYDLQIYDLAGNVQEWVQDETDAGVNRVIKGGSFFGDNDISKAKPDSAHFNVGFRCAAGD